MKEKKNRPFIIKRSGWSAFSILAYLVLGVVLPALFLVNTFLDYKPYMAGYAEFVKTDVTAKIKEETDKTVADYQKLIDELSGKITSVNETKSAKEAAKGTIQSEISDISNEVVGKEEEIATKTAEISDLNSLNSQLDTAKAEYDEKKTALDEKSVAITAIEETIAGYQAIIDEKTIEMEGLAQESQEYQDCQAVIDENQALINEANTEKATLEGEKQTIEQELDEIKTLLVTLLNPSEEVALSDLIAAIPDAKEANDLKVAQLMQEIVTLETAITGLNNEKAAKEANSSTLDNLIQQCNVQVASYQDTQNIYKENQATAEAELAEWKTIVSQNSGNDLIEAYYGKNYNEKYEYDQNDGIFGITQILISNKFSVKGVSLSSTISTAVGALIYAIIFIITWIKIHNARKTKYKFEGNVIIVENGKVFSDHEENKKFIFSPGMSVHMEQSFKGWFFRYGTVVITMGMSTAGEFRMEHVKRARKVRKYIAKQLLQYSYTADYMSKPYISHPYAPANMFPHFFGGMFGMGMGMGHGCGGNGECGCGGTGCGHGAVYPYSSPYSMNGTSFPYNF